MVIFNRVTSVGRLCLAARWILIINHQQPAPDRCALLPPGDKFLADPGGLSLTPPNAPLLKLCVTLRGAGLWQCPRPLPGSSRSRQLSSSHPGSLSSLLGGVLAGWLWLNPTSLSRSLGILVAHLPSGVALPLLSPKSPLEGANGFSIAGDC